MERGFVWLLALGLAAPGPVLAHCDGMDGPVVKAAQKALRAGDAGPALIWVRAQDEQEIRQAFARTLEVRRLGVQARELADRWFFETLVRVHRAGEGVPYTGLQPAGRDLGPAIPAADRAIETGSTEALGKLLRQALGAGLESRFHAVLEKKTFPAGNIGAAREYVHAYVEFVHWVERLYEAAAAPAGGHPHESQE